MWPTEASVPVVLSCSCEGRSGGTMERSRSGATTGELLQSVSSSVAQLMTRVSQRSALPGGCVPSRSFVFLRVGP